MFQFRLLLSAVVFGLVGVTLFFLLGFFLPFFPPGFSWILHLLLQTYNPRTLQVISAALAEKRLERKMELVVSLQSVSRLPFQVWARIVCILRSSVRAETTAF